MMTGFQLHFNFSKVKMKLNKKIVPWLLLALLALIWGSSFILIKRSLLAFSWDQVAVLRISIAMFAFLPFLYTQIKKMDWSKWKAVLAMATFGNGIPAFLYPIAQTQMDSSLVGVLNSLTPLMVFLFGVILLKNVVVKQKLLGLFIGLIGTVILILYGQNINENSNNWYGIFAILASVCYGFSTIIIKRDLQNMSPITSGAIAFLMIGPFALIYLFSTDFLSVMETHPDAYTSFASVSVLGLVSTVFATIVFIKVIQLTSALLASMVSYLIPITAILFGLYDGEIITVWHLAGMVLILLGVYLTKDKPVAVLKSEN